ncbi:MAG: hypothetical protein ACKOPS_18190 [Cyanobium sp.]
MEAPLMAGLESQGIASHGPMPAGMLRIRQGNPERYVWPVHLGGWLAMGWRVAGAGAEGPSIGVAAAEPPASATVLDPVPAAESPSEPAPTRGRRGRRRKDEATASAAAEPSTEPAWQAEPGITPGKNGARADSEGEFTGGELGNQQEPDAGSDADPSADAAVVSGDIEN